MNKFEKAMKEDKPCPKCGESMIFIKGEGYDYDQEFCSKCEHEVEHDTSSYVEED